MEARSESWRSKLVRLVVLAAPTALIGCNAILGNDEGVYVPSSATGTAAGGGGAGAGTSTGPTGGGASATGTGGAVPCSPECDQGCFEDICGGFTPVDVAPGEQVSCVVVKSGSVWCFGANRFGGVGIPPNDSLDTCQTKVGGEFVPCSLSPVRVELPARAKQIATGRHAACAVLDDGRLYCWGLNDVGQLGHPPGAPDEDCEGQQCHPAPIEVEGLGGVAGVAMDWTHACALTSSSEVFCWGKNEFGQIGDGTSDPDAILPPTKAAMPAAIAVSVADGHTCAVQLGTYGLWCWGEDTFGASLVDPVKSDLCTGFSCVPTPAEIAVPAPLNGAAVIGTPRSATCFAGIDGGFYCGGWNGMGFLGTPTDPDPHPEPVILPVLSNVAQVSGGDLFACALAGSQVFCWGANNAGQLGRGMAGGKVLCAYGLPCDYTPAPVPGVEAVRLRSAPHVSMAITIDGKVMAWGMNQGGQLGHAPGTGTDASCTYAGGGSILCNPSATPVEGLPKADPK